MHCGRGLFLGLVSELSPVSKEAGEGKDGWEARGFPSAGWTASVSVPSPNGWALSKAAGMRFWAEAGELRIGLVS